MKTMTLKEFRAVLKSQGVPREHVAFKCPVCGTIQSPADLIAVGAGADFDAVERYVGFSCVGRWTDAGPAKKNAEPGSGCDWTLGGFFSLHELEVITADEERHPHFEPATPEEAQAHFKLKDASPA